MGRQILDEAAGSPPAEGLRERKKRLMRQQLSDTATRMFMEHGFDAVRVAEVAEACGVSEKTVFNYFPTKESLVLDRLAITVTSLRAGLADPGTSPVQAALQILDRDLKNLTDRLRGHDNPARAAAEIRRFGDLIRATPSLRAYQSDMMDQFVTVAAQVLAERAGMRADEPEPQIAARALLGLWRVQADSLRTHLDRCEPAQLHGLVTSDVRRAARLIDAGLHTFGPARRRLPEGRPGGQRYRQLGLQVGAQDARHVKPPVAEQPLDLQAVHQRDELPRGRCGLDARLQDPVGADLLVGVLDGTHRRLVALREVGVGGMPGGGRFPGQHGEQLDDAGPGGVERREVDQSAQDGQAGTAAQQFCAVHLVAVFQHGQQQ